MRQLMRYRLDHAGAAFLEVDGWESGVERIARNGIVAVRVVTTFVAMVEPLRSATGMLVRKLGSSVGSLHPIQVDFRVRPNAEVEKAEAVIAANERRGHFQVELARSGSRDGTISG